MILSASITNRLQFQHHTIEELIDGYNEKQLKERSVPDKWSVFENIVYLVTYQMVFQQRMGKMLVQHRPTFEKYVAENDPSFNKYLQRPLQELLQSLHEVRKQIFQQLNDLSADQLSSVGLHPIYGTMSLVQWIDFFLLHEAHHLFTMFKLLRKEAKS